MPIPESSPDIFDQWAQAAPPADAAPAAPSVPADDAAPAAATPLALRRALQELLKHGLLEQTAKPHLFRQIASDTGRVNAHLEPLDLEVRVDDVRGLAFVAIPPGYQPDGEDEDEWTHPLVRRQRLTLEQSLLLAILRREFLQREQESGLGVPVRMAVESLLPQLEIYLGRTGSDMQERKRLAVLLEGLRGHGVVSEVDAQESITVRPMIVHLANPHNLQALLQHLRTLAQGAGRASEEGTE
ncbi:DUF4194 domain-containing protein [Paracidovorax avenae]|uniref:DUF4194 domain-containing protein n=1 Tax=Paracidovorax avenae TaxID=80867 RepID=UPI0009EB8B29|nr:DUF4194 domain-containing protein [Paracidovorax avenae]